MDATATVTAPAPTREPVPFPFTCHVPTAIDDDPAACVRFWQHQALEAGYDPAGPPEVLHYERRLITVRHKPTWVCDDGSPVDCVIGPVVPHVPTRR